MAEPEEAGPVPDGHVDPRPKASRPITIAATVRQMERQLAPLREEMARGQRLRRQIDQWAEPLRRVAAELGLDEESTASGTPVESAEASPTPPPPPKPEPASRPAFEVDPGEKLLAAMRQAFPGFTPTGRWWFHAERELKDAHHRSHPERHAAFCAAYWRWSAEDLIRHLESEGRIPSRPKGGRKHKRNVEGLGVGQWVAAMLAADKSFRYLSQKEAAKLGPFGARTIGTCEVWIQMKADLEAEAQEAAERAKAELNDGRREDEGPEDHIGLRHSSTKYGVGIQRPTREDLKHERDVKAFLRSKADQTANRRAK